MHLAFLNDYTDSREQSRMFLVFACIWHVAALRSMCFIYLIVTKQVFSLSVIQGCILFFWKMQNEYANNFAFRYSFTHKTKLSQSVLSFSSCLSTPRWNRNLLGQSGVFFLCSSISIKYLEAPNK